MQATIDISKAQPIPGWMSDRELSWLAARAQECKTIIEFGTFHGRSARALADNMDASGNLWCVDPWAGEYKGVDPPINTFCYPEFVNNLKDHISAGRVIPVRGYSYNFKLPFQVDMIFIDGDHRYEYVLKDIDKAIELVKPGGIISGHDYDMQYWEGVKRAVDEKFPTIQQEEFIWWTRK